MVDSIGGKLSSAPINDGNAASKQSPREKELREKAVEFEAVFVAQMLKHGGLVEAIAGDSGFGGESFAGLLLEEYAQSIVENGGFGLADNVYEQLRALDEGANPLRSNLPAEKLNIDGEAE